VLDAVRGLYVAHRSADWDLGSSLNNRRRRHSRWEFERRHHSRRPGIVRVRCHRHRQHVVLTLRLRLRVSAFKPRPVSYLRLYIRQTPSTYSTTCHSQHILCDTTLLHVGNSFLTCSFETYTHTHTPLLHAPRSSSSACTYPPSSSYISPSTFIYFTPLRIIWSPRLHKYSYLRTRPLSCSSFYTSMTVIPRSTTP
jgi:hypothetical protein